MQELKTFRMIVSVAASGSIRKAAAQLNITPSALNRRIRQFEEGFGAEIFERLSNGVQLNAAGEVLLRHIRTQLADFQRVQQDVADLGELRRGHVTIGASQAAMNIFLPAEIARFRAQHPNVTFTLKRRDRAEAEKDLMDYAIDLALVFEPIYLAHFEQIAVVPQPICAVMAHDHPLAKRERVYLSDCLSYPHVLPTRDYGVRHLLELAVSRLTLSFSPVVESESFEFMRYFVLQEQAVGFQIRLGLKDKTDSKTAVREIADPELQSGSLFVGCLKARQLPLAAQRFADQLVARLGGTCAEPATNTGEH